MPWLLGSRRASFAIAEGSEAVELRASPRGPLGVKLSLGCALSSLQCSLPGPTRSGG
jgi:hypothetical protein